MTTKTSDLSAMTSEDATDCAWCITWQGKELGEGSHGICEVHAEIQYTRYQVNRMPSAMEQSAEFQRSHSLIQW